MQDDIEQRTQELAKAGMMPYAIFEPRYPHTGVGAALSVRAAMYFKGGYTSEKRQALAKVFDLYIALASRAFQKDEENPIKWLWFNGKRALKFAKAPSLWTLEKRVDENEGFDAIYVGGEAAHDASYYEFTTFCLEKFQAALGTRGLDVAAFTLPAPFVYANPDDFVSLFQKSAAMLDAVHGHAGLAVNLSPSGRTENESSEYFMSRQLGPGVDVGSPTAMEVRDLTDRIKTVNWLTLIDNRMVQHVGHLEKLRSELPPDWYDLSPCAQGLLIRTGVSPQAGIQQGEGKPVAPPPAYVVLNAALRDLIPETVSILQQGTASGDAPVYNSKTSSDAWLHRFDVTPEQLLAAKAAVLDTPKLPGRDQL